MGKKRPISVEDFRANPRDTHYVIFGSERLARLFSMDHHIDWNRITLATEGAAGLRGVRGPIECIRFHEDVWSPATFPCERRVREIEERIKEINGTT